METQALQVKRKEQLRLFPDEEDAAIHGLSDAYRRLDDVGQKIVRGYLIALNRSGDWPTQSRIAEAANLGRSTVCERLKADSSIMSAITEIIVATRDDVARRTSVTIPQLAALIARQFFPGEGKLPRDTRTLTKQELEVLKLASIMAGVTFGDGPTTNVTLGTRVASDGSTQTIAQVNVGQQAPSSVPPTLESVIKSLVDVQRQRVTEVEQETANSVRVEEDTP